MCVCIHVHAHMNVRINICMHVYILHVCIKDYVDHNDCILSKNNDLHCLFI